MPVWHEKTRGLEKSGKLAVAGIVQEQHADRARLFMQWKRMGWPVMVDSLNLLGVPVVPVTVFIDEVGIVQKVNARPGDLVGFLAMPPAVPSRAEPAPDGARSADRAAEFPGAALQAQYADAMFARGDAGQLSRVIEFYERAIAEGETGALRFRLGVAHRRRAESPWAEPDDFAKAVRNWRRALAIDPNQYIWRRRLQQYGPRLDKPYPFYDWVVTAREEIEAQGATPVPLRVEPSGAEFAQPARSFSATPEGGTSAPDPEGRIHRDAGPLIRIEAVTVPHTGPDGTSARVHLTLRPDRAADAHWNNEVDDVVVWLEAPPGWTIDRRLIRIPRATAAVSDEARTAEFEINRVDASSAANDVRVRGYVLYYVCEGADGKCLYLRRDLEIDAAVR